MQRNAHSIHKELQDTPSDEKTVQMIDEQPVVTLRPKSSVARLAKNANRYFFKPLNDTSDTVATMYGYVAKYALLVNGPNRMFFNLAYFTPTLVPLSLHFLPFQPENKKRHLKKFHAVSHIALNAAFLSSQAQSLLFLFAHNTSRTDLIIEATAIEVITTLVAIPCGYYDLKMRDGERYSATGEALIKFVIRPLQSAATLGFFLDIFSSHLHDAPIWMPTVVGAGLGLSRLGYEIYRHQQRNHHLRQAVERFIENVIQDGLLTNLSTHSVIFTVIESLYAARHEDKIPDAVFYSILGLVLFFYALSMTGSMISYVTDDVTPNNQEQQPLLTDLPTVIGDVNDTMQMPPASEQGFFSARAKAKEIHATMEIFSETKEIAHPTLNSASNIKIN